ncbi:dihydrolipoyl dehydrogenase [Engelhardtia mirabilis]|uniref:Dihydrolipoyl dehydrogenase n=1 Tax=Engelhardtia mirabilis TaxID=2528011 RepID=A0A518BJE3_9BACT|nr:Dihydrolipoyl dehydrogenase 3 [Planctomycetes bacterium Pla133]QDV01436.1 Dihydrolipoyl dehydrogenase 3 [Planctomycetes bacterium Pla86]
MSETTFDVVIIGAGPGGYVAAIRAAQLGLKTACVEKADALGGTCLRIGCIPSKALLESSELFHQAGHDFAAHGIGVPAPTLDLATMLARKDKTVEGLTGGVAFLFKKNGVTHFKGSGQLLGAGKVLVEGADGRTELTATDIVIATGSKVAPLRGVEVDGERVVTSTEALSFDAVPNHLVVIGAGAIGLELGSVWHRLGAEVTVLEYADRVLPGMDAEISKEAGKLFKKQGLKLELGARVTGARADGDGAVVEVEGRDPIRCDRVLLAVGRIPNTEGLGLEAAGLSTDERGRIAVDDHRCTAVPHIYAIGDVIAGPMLAHKAEDEGVAVAERIANGGGHVNYGAIPNVVYTHPEVASVGRTEEELKRDDVPYRSGSFPFIANGRAKALGQTSGKVKVLAHAETDRVLGVHIIGARAGDLIAEAAVAMEFGASAEDIARSCHAHPTLAEVLKEAAMDVDGRAIHS